MNIQDIRGLNEEQKDDIIVQIIRIMKEESNFNPINLVFSGENDGFYDCSYCIESEIKNEKESQIIEFTDESFRKRMNEFFKDNEIDYEITLALIIYYLNKGMVFKVDDKKKDQWIDCLSNGGIFITLEDDSDNVYNEYCKKLSSFSLNSFTTSNSNDVDDVFYKILEKYKKEVDIILINKETHEVIVNEENKELRKSFIYSVKENNLFKTSIDYKDLLSGVNGYNKTNTVINVAARIKPYKKEVYIQPQKWEEYSSNNYENEENVLYKGITEQMIIQSFSPDDIVKEMKKCISDKNAIYAFSYPYYIDDSTIRYVKKELFDEKLNVYMYPRKDVIESYYQIQNKSGISVVCDINLLYATVSIYDSGENKVYRLWEYDEYSNPIMNFKRLFVAEDNYSRSDNIIIKTHDLVKNFYAIYIELFLKQKTETKYRYDENSNKEIIVKKDKIVNILKKCYKAVNDLLNNYLGSYVNDMNKNEVKLYLCGALSNNDEIKRIFDDKAFDKCYYTDITSDPTDFSAGYKSFFDDQIVNSFDFCLKSKDYLGREILLEPVVTGSGEVKFIIKDIKDCIDRKKTFSLLFYQKSKNYLDNAFSYDTKKVDKKIVIKVTRMPDDYVEGDKLIINANLNKPMKKCVNLIYMRLNPSCTIKLEYEVFDKYENRIL